MGVRLSVWAVVVALWAFSISGPQSGVSGIISKQEKLQYKERVLEMFFHAYYSYMDHAYPADELMPLTCKGRVRGRDRGRGDIDEAMGMFSLTLIDSLDTLAVIGAVDDFNSAVRSVIRDVRFDNDVVVSVFETNIRVLGGLLGAHFAAESLKEKGYHQLSWYNGELLSMAEDVGRRLLPAFNTTTGLPYPKVNLRRGMSYDGHDKTTCTACAGTLIMEFAALSRLTGNPEYEVKARRAMEAIWQARDQGHNLVGTTINIHNGEWTRRDSGVGAGIDSYYEYCLKSYILLGDQEYLRRFDKHYSAVMKYISNGPLLVDVSMTSPNRVTRNFMDSLLAFWPGLQVLWGDLDSAIHTHNMLYHVTERHNFLPEAFTLDFRVHWANHPLRPEFIESTYFLYKATGDPYYLDIGKTVIENLNDFARVSCGFAAIKDVKTNSHEDRMDSFVLAETFKYLYLLFAEEEDLVLDMDEFIFNTEAHLFPLSLATFNSTLIMDQFSAALLLNSSTASTNEDTPDNQDTPTTNQSESDAPLPEATVLVPLQCPKDDRSFVKLDEYEKMMLKQCTSSRFRIFHSGKKRKRLTPPRMDVHKLDFGNKEHLIILEELGIVVQSLAGGRVQVTHVMQKAKSPEDAEEGWYLMQDIMKMMSANQNPDGHPKRDAKLVKVLSPDLREEEIRVGPALFGPDLGEHEFQVAAELVETEPLNGCSDFNRDATVGKIVLISRGGCIFVQKVRSAQKGGAAGVIIADNLDYNSTNTSTTQLPFSMSGDGSKDIEIPSVFMQRRDADRLRELMTTGDKPVHVLLTWLPKDQQSEEKEEESEQQQETASGREHSDNCEEGGTCDKERQNEERLEQHSSLFDDGSDPAGNT